MNISNAVDIVSALLVVYGFVLTILSFTATGLLIILGCERRVVKPLAAFFKIVFTVFLLAITVRLILKHVI